MLLLTASGQDTKPSSEYQESRTVLSSVSKHEHFYQVTTESRIYLLMDTKVKTHAVRPTGVQVGDNPMATGETIDFRSEGDWAYMAPIPSETGRTEASRNHDRAEEYPSRAYFLDQ